MKTLTIISALLLASIYSLAQNPSQLSREEKRQMKKEIRQSEDSALYANAVNAIKQKSWVLEAYQLQTQRGYTVQVNSTTNFIMVNENSGTVQFASPNRVGFNGLGGLTLQGNITGYTVNTDKKGTLTVNYNVLGSGINATIFITLYPNTNQATVTISPNTWGRALTYYGYIYLRQDSDVFMGMPRY